MSSQNRLLENVMHFGRLLRASGLPVGPGRVLDAARAVEAAGIRRRDDFYWTLHALFVNHPGQRYVFDQAFHVFWRNPRLLEKMMGLMLPEMRVPHAEDEEELARRVGDALSGPDRETSGGVEEQVEQEVASMSWSGRDKLGSMDFEAMSADEIEAARRAIARMRLPDDLIRTRRYRAATRGARVDLRRAVQSTVKGGGDVWRLPRRRQLSRPPPLVVLCDISGSMSRYSRMMLHFMHHLAQSGRRVHAFVFGTRLSNITRHLRTRDIDVALDAVCAAVPDWQGGTRIGACLHEFNRDWSRRVLGQSPTVILVSDGLDREGGDTLSFEMRRLKGSCRRLIWLNPLLRYDGFEPKAAGIRAMLPHVHEFRTIHNLDAMSELVAALATDRQGRARAA